MVHLFCFYFNVVLPRTQHMFAEGRVLAGFQRSSGAGAGGKEEAISCISTPQWGRAEMHPGSVSTPLRAVCFGICFFSSQWPEWLFSSKTRLVQWRDEKWAAIPVALGGLTVLDSLHSVWPHANHSSFNSVSIKCMTHLSGAKKLKGFVFLSLKGKT